MRRTRVGYGVAVASVVVGITALVLNACAASPPTLRTSLADGAKDVPLDSSLEVTAVSAKLEQALLERVDAPAPALELALTKEGARLGAGMLEPDARYRLVASAEPDRATPLPWSAPSTKLSVERVFDTVHTPVLIGADEPLLFTRGQPLTLRFSEPLRQARAESPRAPAEARVARDDPHVVQLELKNPRPGEELSIRLVDLLGANGVTAPEQTVVVQTPDPARIVSVNGAEGDRITLPPDVAVLLEWGTPVTSVRYRVGDTSATWKGAPTTDVELPIRLGMGQSETLTIEDADAVDGGWLPAARTFELAGAAPLQLAAFWPANGATGLLPQADPTFRFSEPITDRAAAEKAITFDPSVPGRFEWLAPNRVRFLPENAFPRQTEVTMKVNGGPQGVRGASGSFLNESHTSVFTTGKEKRIEVSLSRQSLALYENDVAVWSAPVATGVKGAETPPGTYKVEYKMPIARFRGVNPGGSRYDIPDVHWVIAFYGDYTIHGAYWRTTFGQPGSNGCISLTDANARYVFNWADEGTPIVVRR